VLLTAAKRLEIHVRIFVPRQLMLLSAAIVYAALCHANTMAGISSRADDQQRPGNSGTTDSTTNSEDTTTSEDVENDKESDEDRQATAANERFLALLKKQPRPGTALDRVYDFHLERGSLDQFLSQQRSLISVSDSTGVACLLVGLFETKRGNHREASRAFQLAEERRTRDATASWLLGRSLLELQQAEDAATALERALERSPQKADLLLIFQDLGRAYRRSRQTGKANAVWQRMESQFPSDVRVKEQIATTLLEEGDPEAAVVRFGELSKLHRDPYLKTQSAITAADIKLQLGRRDEALRDLEEQLQTLDPDSWLALDIRRRIEQSFLRNNDEAGLVSYYETWLQNHPDDLNIMASLGHALALQGRGLDAQNWYRKALEKAPQDIPLRKSLVQQLVRDHFYEEAMTHYQKLHEIDPGNNEHLREWGLSILYRDDLPLAERRAIAADIWKRMLSVRPDEPGVLVQVAELMRRAELPDEALPLYRRAVELAPQDAEYREYLGDYLNTLGRTDEAMLAWEAIANGDRRTAANLIRLAEIFRATGLQDKAISAMQAACELTPEFNELLKLARWLREYELDGRNPRAVDALKQLDIAESLAESDEERRLVLAERIQTLMAARQLNQAIRELTLRLQSSEVAGVTANGADEAKKNAVEWVELAVYLEAAKRLPEAMEAAKKATAIAPESADAWTVAARLYEQSGRYADAVDAYRKLLSLDPRGRTTHLQSIAGLEQRLGRRAEALKAGKELLAAGPESPEFIKFYADLCLHFGERQEAFRTLRRSVRSSAADGTLILALARTLANQNEIDEAMSLCWTAFEKSSNLDDKSSAVMMLAEFSLRANRFDQLIEKLQQHGRVSGKEQDAAHCLATAYRVAGDLRSARQALETLLVADHRDSQLFLQLSRLAEEDGDLEAAADYQRRANSVVASDEGETRLANLLVRLGDLSEAEALWTRIGSDTAAPADVIEAIDQLIALESVDAVREICDRALTQNPANWEVLIRRGILEWRFGDRENAAQIFQRVLDLAMDSNTPSATLKTALKQTDPGEQRETQRLPALARLETVPELAESFQESMPSWWFGQKVEPEMPRDYGAARIVAIIGRYLAARPSSSESAILKQLAEENASGELQATCDQLGLEIFILDRTTDKLFTDSDFQRFMLSAEVGDIEAQAMLLELLARRINVWEIDDDVESNIDDLPTRFLSETQFSVVMNSFNNVLNQKPEWLETFDAPRLFCICRHQKRLETLDKLIATLLQREGVGPQLSMGIDLGLLRQSLTAQSAINAMSRPKSAPGTVNSAGAVEMNSGHEADFESFSPGLLKTARIKPTAGEVHPGLKVLDWWLEWRRESRGEFGLRPDPSFEHQAAREMIDGVVFKNRSPDFGVNSAVIRKDSNVAAKLGVRNRFTDREYEFLTQVFALFLQEKSSLQLTEFFKTKSESSEKARLADLELMQVVFWNIQGHHERVLLHLVRAIEQSPDDNLLKLVVALRLEELNMRAEAIELIDQLPDTDPLLLRCREFKLLDLAKTLQLSEVAKVSLTRLTGMDLSESERDYVFRELGRFGLEDVRAELESRRTKVKAETIEASPLALLDHYEQQGNLEAAVQVAQQLLRRSHKNPTPWRNTTRPTPKQIYARAYKVLKETGELEKMIERQKAQLAKSPHSGRLQNTLLDYLEAAGRITEADELRASRQRNEPGLSAEVLITQAEELIAAKQPQMACDKLLTVIHKHPAEFWLEATNEQFLGLFAETNRLTELADAVLLADRGRFESCAPTETLEELIKLLLRDPKTHGKAAEMIQRYAEMYPANTVMFLQLVEQLPLWSSSDELFALLTRMYVPSNVEQLKRPLLAWPLEYEYRRVQLGYDQAAINSGGNLKRLWDALKFSDERRIELEKSTKDAMVKIPDWPAGPVILIVSALSVPEKSLDLDRIETLVNEMCDDSNRAIPEAVADNITQLLRQRGERMKRAAVKLLETSLNAVPPVKLNLDQPASRALIELYAELNEPDKVQEFRRRSIRESSPIDPALKKLQREENSRDAKVVPRDSSPPAGGDPLAEQVKAEIRKTLLKRNP
jgi:tetratricopeptide (TPR) repeat protein